MLLKVVAHAWYVCGDFNSVGQTHSRNLAQRGVGLLGSLRINASANTALLWRTLKRRARGFVLDVLASLTNQLINRRHFMSFFPFCCWPTPERKKGITCLFPERCGCNGDFRLGFHP